MGIREPRLGKCNDSRLFCIQTRFGEVLCRIGEKLQWCTTMEAFLSTIHKLSLLVFMLAFPACATFVAVLETISGSDVITREEKMYLTDVLRSEAVKALPAEQNYTIMTRENINIMLPPGKAIEECEGSCLVETGKNIAADYVAQGRVGRFADNLTITVELYETAGNKLMDSFSSKASNIEFLEMEIRQKSQEMFSKIVALENAYKLKDAKPELDESQKAADDAARDVAESNTSSIKKPVSIALMALGLASVGIGIYQNSVAKDERKKYDDAKFKDKRDFDDQWDKVTSARNTRNVLYGVGLGLIGAGSVIFFVF